MHLFSVSIDKISMRLHAKRYLHSPYVCIQWRFLSKCISIKCRRRLFKARFRILSFVTSNMNHGAHQFEKPKNKNTVISRQSGHKIHIFALSDIWIYAHENKFYNINGYNAYLSNRNNNRSGCCCIFVLNELRSMKIVIF